MNPAQVFFLLIETPSGLYSEQKVLSPGVSTNPSCLVCSLEHCAVRVTREVCEFEWPAVKAVLRGATVSTFREEKYHSCAVLAVY